jgi:hypothetical protein
MARAAAVCALVLALLPVSAHAARKRPRPPLWATVNVCDTARHPNAIGVRASMPGITSRRQRMYMRFRIQWRDPADHLWHNIVRNGDSGWIALGSHRGPVQTGQTFAYRAPPAGQRLLLRGVVRFQWRRGRRVVRHTSRITEGGHRVVAGSDPRRHSAATCTLRP